MNELIFQTDPYESTSRSKKTLKIGYLQQEIKNLKDQISDLNKVAILNKETLKIAFESTGENNNNLQSEKQFKKVVDNLLEENNTLKKKVFRLTNDRDSAHSKVFINF